MLSWIMQVSLCPIKTGQSLILRWQKNPNIHNRWLITHLNVDSLLRRNSIQIMTGCETDNNLLMEKAQIIHPNWYLEKRLQLKSEADFKCMPQQSFINRMKSWTVPRELYQNWGKKLLWNQIKKAVWINNLQKNNLPKKRLSILRFWLKKALNNPISLS